VGHRRARHRRSHSLSVVRRRQRPVGRIAKLRLEPGNWLSADPRLAHYHPPANHLKASAASTSKITVATHPSPNTLPVPTVVEATDSGRTPRSCGPASPAPGSGLDPMLCRSSYHGSTTGGTPGVGGPKRKNVSKSQVPFSKTKSSRCGTGSPPNVTST
jgi:hypothetical protein